MKIEMTFTLDFDDDLTEDELRDCGFTETFDAASDGSVPAALELLENEDAIKSVRVAKR